MDESEQQPPSDTTVSVSETQGKTGLFSKCYFISWKLLEVFPCLPNFLFLESNGTTALHVSAVPVTTYMPSEALVPMPVLPQSGAVSLLYFSFFILAFFRSLLLLSVSKSWKLYKKYKWKHMLHQLHIFLNMVVMVDLPENYKHGIGSNAGSGWVRTDWQNPWLCTMTRVVVEVRFPKRNQENMPYYIFFFQRFILYHTFKIIVGPGAKKEAQLLGLGLIKLRSKQKDWLADAKKYAKEQSIKQVLLRQTLAHQQNVSISCSLIWNLYWGTNNICLLGSYFEE